MKEVIIKESDITEWELRWTFLKHEINKLEREFEELSKKLDAVRLLKNGGEHELSTKREYQGNSGGAKQSAGES